MAKATGKQADINFVDVFQRVKLLVAQLDTQVGNVLYLEDSEGGADLDPDTIEVEVTIEQRPFVLHPSAIGDLKQLIDPLLQSANDRITEIVADLKEMVGLLHQVCFPHGQDARPGGDEAIEIPHAGPDAGPAAGAV